MATRIEFAGETTPLGMTHSLEALFDSIDEGLAVVEMIRDNGGEIVDMIYRRTNGAFERIGGVRDVVGRSIFDVLPNVEDHWLELYKQVARTGAPIRHQDRQRDVDRWFDVYFARVDEAGRFVVTVFNDITAQKRAEAALRESEERQRFLLALGDAMRVAPSAGKKINVAARLLGERLGASRVLYAEFDWARNVPHIFGGWFADGAQPFPTAMRLEDYDGEILRNLRAGCTVRVDNVGERVAEPAYAAVAALGVQALLSIPLIVEGTLKLNISIHQHAPRPWADDEVAIVQEVAERLWAEVVRVRFEEALHESEERQKFLLNLSDALGPLTSSAQITEVALTCLCERLQVDRVCYAEMRATS